MMKFETKYGLSDRVHTIKNIVEPKNSICKKCNGRGNLDLKDGGIIKCPDCKEGIVVEYHNVWVYGGEAEVEQVCISGYGCQPKPQYYFWCSWWDEIDIFPTKEEALAECEKRNKKEK